MKPIQTNKRFYDTMGQLRDVSRTKKLAVVEHMLEFTKARHRVCGMYETSHWLAWTECLSALREALAEGVDE